eukprot:scaffold155404_cov21-Tisochrysis_lutea.AAC.2
MLHLDIEVRQACICIISKSSIDMLKCKMSVVLWLQLTEETYIKICKLAELDAKKWDTGIRVEAGFIQITKEFIPARRHLLLKDVHLGHLKASICTGCVWICLSMATTSECSFVNHYPASKSMEH